MIHPPFVPTTTVARHQHRCCVQGRALPFARLSIIALAPGKEFAADQCGRRDSLFSLTEPLAIDRLAVMGEDPAFGLAGRSHEVAIAAFLFGAAAANVAVGADGPHALCALFTSNASRTWNDS